MEKTVYLILWFERAKNFTMAGKQGNSQAWWQEEEAESLHLKPLHEAERVAPSDISFQVGSMS